MSRRAVFLDRDGVLVETHVRDGRAYAPVSLADFRICPDAGPQVARLKTAGLVPIVFTNQPEVARGTLTLETLDRMHRALTAAVDVAEIFVCVHEDRDGCECRKPKPGMLHAAAAKWGLELSKSFVIGDRWRDIEAGEAAGCQTVLIDRPYSACPRASARVSDLVGAVDVVVARAAAALDPDGPVGPGR